MNLYEFTRAWIERCEEHPSERRGQALFNTLELAMPHLAREMRGTGVDPFYDDARLPLAWTWIGASWLA